MNISFTVLYAVELQCMMQNWSSSQRVNWTRSN